MGRCAAGPKNEKRSFVMNSDPPLIIKSNTGTDVFCGPVPFFYLRPFKFICSFRMSRRGFVVWRVSQQVNQDRYYNRAYIIQSLKRFHVIMIPFRIF